MPNFASMSYTSIRYHIVIRTKNSLRTINEDYERVLYAYIYSYMKTRNCVLYRIGGMPDHIHILMSLHPTVALADFVRDMKTASSKFIKSEHKKFPMFEGWGSEYYASTLSQSQQDAVRQYIMNQKEHHKHESSRNEIIRLCYESGIVVDERFL